MKIIEFMNIVKKPIFHIFALIIALTLALSLRLIRLGITPLSNMEAGIALQALADGQGTEAVFGEHAAYVGLTGLDFFLFAPGNFLARFWPAIFGAMIVFIPFLFREQIGYFPASILALVLAITPEMVGLSRIIGSPIIAFVSLFLAFGFLVRRKPVLSGLTFALSLMGGSGFWTGIVLFLLGLAAARKFLDFKIERPLFNLFFDRIFRIKFFAAWLVTIGIVGTGFFLSPESLSGVFSGLVNFIHGFGESYTQPFYLRPLALIGYSLPAVILGIWGGIRAILNRKKLDLFLFIIAGLGLAYFMLYPGADPADLIWVTLPLWTLSARLVFSVWRLPEDNRLIMAVTGLVVVIIFMFLLMTLRSILNPGFSQDIQLVTIIALFGGLVLLIALVLLVTFGWSEEIALSGFLIGLSVVIIFGMIAVTTRTTGLSTEDSIEVWYPDQHKLSTRWLKIAIERVLDWNKRRVEPLEIVVVDLDLPGMHWALQEYDDVAFVPYLPPTTQPGILISNILTQPEISNSYRGQDLVWSEKARWQDLSAMQVLSWLIIRDAPMDYEEIILWVRTDLMPDEQLTQ